MNLFGHYTVLIFWGMEFGKHTDPGLFVLDASRLEAEANCVRQPGRAT